LNGELGALLGVIEGADVAPTTQAVSGAQSLEQALAELMKRWNDIKSRDVPALNGHLRQANLPALTL